MKTLIVFAMFAVSAFAIKPIAPLSAAPNMTDSCTVQTGTYVPITGIGAVPIPTDLSITVVTGIGAKAACQAAVSTASAGIGAPGNNIWLATFAKAGYRVAFLVGYYAVDYTQVTTNIIGGSSEGSCPKYPCYAKM